MTSRSHSIRILSATLCAGLSIPAVAAAAGNAAVGKMKAQPCTVCHGAAGISTLPDAPNLAGQPEIYISNQLRAFRNGERRHEVMNVVARPLSDDDISSLAAWFSSIRIEVKAPD